MQALLDSEREIVTGNNYEITGLNDTNSLLYKLNPDLRDKFGSEISTIISDPLIDDKDLANLKVVAYLCNEANWRDYDMDGAESDIYAFGGPSAEMFCLSYNARSNSETEYVSVSSKFYNSIGYRYSPGATNSFYYSDGFGTKTDWTNHPISEALCDAMYTFSSYSWCLASPSCGGYNSVCTTSRNGLGYSSNQIKVRPVVSLPQSFQLNLTDDFESLIDEEDN